MIEFKQILLKREDLFARMLVKRLLTYATGRRIEATERPEVERIAGELKARGNGMRTLIELAISSPIFLSR